MGVLNNGRDPYPNVPETTRQQDEGRDDIPRGPKLNTKRFVLMSLIVMLLVVLLLVSVA